RRRDVRRGNVGKCACDRRGAHVRVAPRARDPSPHALGSRMMATSTASEGFNQDPLLGKTVGGRYAIERLIGRGGVGLVYLADDPVEQRKVVVKVLAPHWAEDRDAVTRFDREALRMAK